MDITLKKRAFKKLAMTNSDAARIALEKEFSKIAFSLKTETEYDILVEQIELLDIIAFRVHNESIDIFCISSDLI